MSNIEAALGRRLNRKNPPQHLPVVMRVVAGFAINPPELFTTADVTQRTKAEPAVPHGLGMHLVGKEMYSLMDFGLVQRSPDGYPYNPSMRSVFYLRSNAEDWDIAMQVLDVLRPLPAIETTPPLE